MPAEQHRPQPAGQPCDHREDRQLVLTTGAEEGGDESVLLWAGRRPGRLGYLPRRHPAAQQAFPAGPAGDGLAGQTGVSSRLDVVTVHGKKVKLGGPLPAVVWTLDYELDGAGAVRSEVADTKASAGASINNRSLTVPTPTVTTGPGTVIVSESLAEAPITEQGCSWNISLLNANAFGAVSNYRLNTFSDSCPNGTREEFNSAVRGTAKVAAGTTTPLEHSASTTTGTAPPTTQVPTTTVPTTTLATTKVVDVSPVNAEGVPKPGYTITHGGKASSCESASDVLGNAYRCFAGNDIYDPCWADTAAAPTLEVLCLTNPYDTTATMLTVSTNPTNVSGLAVAGGLQPFTTPTPIDLATPWALQLSDGQRCSAVQSGASTFRGQRVNF